MRELLVAKALVSGGWYAMCHDSSLFPASGWLCAAPPRPRALPLLDRAGAGGAAGRRLARPSPEGARRELARGTPNARPLPAHWAAGVQTAGARAGTGAPRSRATARLTAAKGMQGRRTRPPCRRQAAACIENPLPQAAARSAREWRVGPKARSSELPEAIGRGELEPKCHGRPLGELLTALYIVLHNKSSELSDP